MGGVLGRVADSYNDSDDEQPSLGVELEEANAARAGDAAIELPVLVDAAVPGSVSPLLFGGNVFPNGDPSNPINELMLPLLRRLASNTPQISHTRTVMCPFNVNKDSIKAVPRVTTSNTSPSTTIYDLQFTFDATEPCIVKVFVCVDETFSNGAFEYLDASSGAKMGAVPSSLDSVRQTSLDSSTQLSLNEALVEKRFEAGLGQTFFTLGAQAVDITKYSLSHLLWNQLEQQMEADKVYIRNNETDSDASNSDGENAENDSRDDADEEENEGEGRRSDDDEEEQREAQVSLVLDPIDEEVGLARNNRTRSARRNRRKKKRSSLPALPRPKPLTEPLLVRNLYPVVITIEPVLEHLGIEAKPVVEAQITHACFVALLPKTQTSAATPEAGVDAPSNGEDSNIETSSTPSTSNARASSSSAAASSSSSGAEASSSSSATTKYECRVLRQKLLVNGAVYNAYDIFGVEANAEIDPLTEETQSTCVICMSEPRTTIVIPCRHMCLCEGCAESLKVQSVKCPICRGPVRGLLKVDVSVAEDQDDEDEVDDKDPLDSDEDEEQRPAPENASRRGGRRGGPERIASSDSEEEEIVETLNLEDSDDDARIEDDEDDEEDDNVHASLVRGAK